MHVRTLRMYAIPVEIDRAGAPGVHKRSAGEGHRRVDSPQRSRLGRLEYAYGARGRMTAALAVVALRVLVETGRGCR